jgi:hypothetical protein
MEGRERESKASRSTMEERENHRSIFPWGRRGPYIGPQQKLAIAGHLL